LIVYRVASESRSWPSTSNTVTGGKGVTPGDEVSALLHDGWVEFYAGLESGIEDDVIEASDRMLIRSVKQRQLLATPLHERNPNSF
jgi:hypothetical protein